MGRKVAIYTRVSTLDQNFSNQLINLRDHCPKMGWGLPRNTQTGVSLKPFHGTKGPHSTP